MRVQFLPPVRTKAEGNNGAPVLGYKVEVAQRVDAVQTFAVEANGPVTSGSYKISLTNARGTQVSSCIPWNATEVMFELALEELLNVDRVSVTRSAYGAVGFGYVYTILFDSKQPNALVGDQTGCAAVTPLNRVLTLTGTQVKTGAQGYVPEVWEIVTHDTAAANVMGGGFDLSVAFDGDWVDSGVTATIAAGSRTVITSVSMIGEVNRGDSIKIGSEEFRVHMTAPFTDTELPLDSYHMRGTTVTAIYLQDTALGSVAVTQNSQTVATANDFRASLAVDEHIKIGSWQFKVAAITATSITIDKIDHLGNDKWPGASTAHITAYKRKKVTIDANADASDVEKALGALPGIGVVEVSRVGPTEWNEYRWRVTFESLGSSSNCPEAPCLRADKVTGATTRLTDAYGAACATCEVMATRLQDESSKVVIGMDGEYVSTSIIASKEIGGIVNEVQTISTIATANDVRGTFAVNFRNTFAQSQGATINYYDTAADVRTKLQNLPTVGRLNVTRSENDQFGFTWTITFLTNTGDLPMLVVDKSGLSGTGVDVVVQEREKGVDTPFEAVVEGLSREKDYYVRAFARNVNGYGTGTDLIQSQGKGALPLTTHIATVPDASKITSVWPISGSEIGVRFHAPDSRGSSICKYQVEYAMGTNFGVSAVKTLSITNPIENDIVGTFRLQYGDDMTPMLSIHTTAAQLEHAFAELPTLRRVTVSRAPFVMTGTTTSRVISLDAARNILTTTPISERQARMLARGVTIRVGTDTFIVETQSITGRTTIEVQSGHGVASFTADRSIIKVDETGVEVGPCGYQWTVTFGSEIEQVLHGSYPGLQFHSSLTSVDAGTAIAPANPIVDVRVATKPDYYGAFDVSNDAVTCDAYVVGARSPDQVVQLFAPTTVTQGRFQLQLGPHTTGCITLGTKSVKSTMKAELEALPYVSRVSVEELREFKVSVLTGSDTAKVTAYTPAQKLTVTALTAAQAAALPAGAIIQVSRNPNDFTRHSCEFTVDTAATALDTEIAVTVSGSCATFSGEARSLKVLDFHDYKVRFWGRYPTGEWPTLKVVAAAFGDATTCTAWTPVVPVYANIHSVKYEGPCAKGQRGIQTILADAQTEIGGFFTLSYRGKETTSLPFQTTTAAKMRDAIDSITQPGHVNVTLSQYSSHGLAWRVTFMNDDDGEDTLFIKHSFLTGQDAVISVYPTVEVFTDARRDDISGTFRVTFGGETTERIGHSATHAKVTQELQKLSVVDSVVALGVTGDVGVTSLKLSASATAGSPVLTGVTLNGKSIDPSLFLAVREQLVIGVTQYWVKAVTADDVTLTTAYTASGTVTIQAGAITKQTTRLPGRVSISCLMRVVTATKNTNTFELPSDHGYVAPNEFYVGGAKFTVATVAAGGIVTTVETYMGDDVTYANPSVCVVDNRLRTTSDLSAMLSIGDEVWLELPAGDMVQYTVAVAVNPRFIPVSGAFTDSLVGVKAYTMGYGRKWSLVFRSYTAELETVDALPQNEWRGTDVRVGTRHPTPVAPQTLAIGNAKEWQTVLLEAPSAADVGGAAKYTLTFGTETTVPIDWTATGDTVKQALEALDAVDGVTVTSVAHDYGFLHTIMFWGMYTMPKLPTLTGKVTAAVNVNKCSILVRDRGAVAYSMRDHLILKSNQETVVRLFALNDKGVSAPSEAFSLQTVTSSIVPTPPTSVALGEYQGTTWLSVFYRPPIYTGGAEITMYRLEWDSSSTFDSASSDYGVANIQKRFEVQQVTTSYRSNLNRGGTFTLSWGGRTTSPLAFDCTAAQMTDALAVITDTTNIPVDPVKVIQTQASWGFNWRITFLHTPGNLATLIADGSLLTGDFPRIATSEVVSGFSDLAIGDFTHEVQDVYTDSKSVLSGSFKLEFQGKVSSSIAVDATALEMQDAIQALTTLHSVKVTRTWRTQATNTAIWSVTFAYLRGEEMVGAGDVFLMTIADSTSLEGMAAVVRVANKVVGSDPFRYTITGLRPGRQYFLHAMAYNTEGFGSATSPMSVARTCGQPDPPKSVIASVVDGTTLAVTWTPSEFNGGCPIDKYKVEWYRSEGMKEEQTITTSAGRGLPEIQRIVNFADSQSLGGFFRLTFGGERTENIAWNAPAVGQNSVKSRLERLSSVGTVDVTRQPSMRVIGGLLVTVNGVTITEDPSSSLTIANAGLAVDNELWLLGKFCKITAVGATTLTVDTSLTDPLVTSEPVPVFKTAHGFEWQITFQAGHVGPQELLIVTPSDSWAGNNPGIYSERVQRGLQPISGTFRVSFASGGLSHITPPLPHNVTADAMKDALQNLVTIGLVNVTRSANGFGFNWLVTFISEVKDEIDLLGVDSTELHGPSIRISAARTSLGEQPGFYCETNGVPGSAAIVELPVSNRYVIGGLQTGQKYAVQVRAHNAKGYGGAQLISPSFQVPRTVPTAPTSPRLLVLSSRELKVRWNAPVSDGGTSITSYKIQWDTSSGFINADSPSYDMQAELRVQPTDTSPFFYNIALTAPGTYYARVFAVNDQGSSPPVRSDPIAATTVDRTPGQPENVRATVLSSFAILVEWDPSSTQKSYYGGDGGLPITQYMIEWDSSAAFDSPASFGLVAGSKREFVIGGNDPVTGVRSSILVPGTLYSIRVTAFNARGAGTPRATTPATVMAANQVPTVPRNLQLSVIPATSIKAQWENPLHDGGSSLKSYEVQWDEQNDFSSGQSESVTIPIVREMQSVTASTDVVNEEQLIDATVEVVNEVQVVRTLFTGADEIQVIQTSNDAVVDEVQTVTTSASDRDEIQELRLDANDVNEIQAVRTTVAEVFETQTIAVGTTRVNEVQRITITLPGQDMTLVSGLLHFSFDNTICTHCTKTVGYRRTVDIVTALTETVDADGATIVKDALEDLDNMDTVTVERASASTDTVNWVYTFTITFTGDGVAGDVPELGIDSTVKYNGFVVNVPPATQAVAGSEVFFHAASVFSVTHTCESYSDPNAITTFSTACTPPTSDRLCTSCVTDFDGMTFTIAGMDLSSTLNPLALPRLIAGVCVFELAAVTATTLTVTAGDVGTLCSTFTDQTLPLFYATKASVPIPVKSAAATISAGSVVENLLNTIIDSVVVVRTQSITATFVGSEYVVTFRKRSGMIPLLECSATAIQVTSGTPECTVTRTSIGSMISGTFTLTLAKESDGAPVTTPAIPWDASETQMKTILEAVADNNELVFGTVIVRRSVFSPTGNKWSGGFTWQIEFTSRGWDIPKMIANPSVVDADNTRTAPAVLVEDFDSPLTPFFAGSRHGNQVAGTITLAYGGVTAEPFTIGVQTDITNLHTTVIDTTLQTYLTAQLGSVIPTIEITRSAATQARGFTWTITFSNPETGGDIPLLDIPLTSLTGQNVRAQVFETVKGNQLGGTFQLKFNGETTGPILFSADKLAVQAQLNSLASIKPSSVIVDRTGPEKVGAQVLSYTWLITFRSSVWADPTSDHSTGIAGNWKGARAAWDDAWPDTGYSKAWGRHVGPMGSIGFMISCIKDGLTTTANDNSQACTTSVQTDGVGPIKGTLTLTLDSTLASVMAVKQMVTSAPIAHNAWATREESGATGTSMEEILESMANVGDVAVSRSTVDPLTGGYTWTVTFLRDKEGQCDQEEDNTNGIRLCNAPGDVPAMVANVGGLSGSTPTAVVCEGTLGNCFAGTVQNGIVLRGDFTTFKVTNDPGFDQRYSLTIACSNGAAPPCATDIEYFDIAPGSEQLPTHLVTEDRFTVGTYTNCIFTVVDVTSTQVQVVPYTCAAMVAGMNNDPRGVSVLLPWNADASLVKRVLEASSDQGNEEGIWEGGRKVDVTRTIHGKYGEVSWRVRFISNPTFTPPGAGNIPDVATVFVPSPAATYRITVTQITPGSVGLSGSFLVDFGSTIGPRQVRFDESEDRLMRKLNEMNTIGRVTVKKLKYPSTETGCTDSACSGGWDDVLVDNSGTRGGYRWCVRFMKVTGEYGGLTFPSGSGNVNPLSVQLGTLAGNEKSIDVTTNRPGSTAILGGFILNTSSAATPTLQYSSSAESMKQGIESMNLFGEVEVTQQYLLTQRIPNAIATLTKDGLRATITWAGVDDIRQYLAPGDLVRFGPTTASNLVGTNGDSLLTGVLATSMVNVEALSPIMQASSVATRRLFPDMSLRVDRLEYTIKQSGYEVQTVTATMPTATYDPSQTSFKLSLRRGGGTQTSATCMPLTVDYATVENDLIAQLGLLNLLAVAGDVKVTKTGPITRTVGGVPHTGFEFAVYFLGDPVAGDVATLLIDTSGCTTITGMSVTVATTTHGGAIGRQRIHFSTDSGQVVDPVGYFKLTMNSGSTPCLPWGITASDLEEQLEDTLGAGDVLVARRGSGTSVTEVQRLRMTSNTLVTAPATGLFQLALTVDGQTSWTSACLAYGLSAEDMQIALNAMTNIAGVVPHVLVTREGDGTPMWGYGYEYTITYRGPISGGYSNVLGNMNKLEILNVGTSPCAKVIGGEPALILETVREGQPGFTYDIFFLETPTAYTPQLAIAHESTGQCATGWSHNGGSVRKAYVEVVDVGGSAEVQTLVIRDPTATIAAGASYKLSFGGAKTNCIDFDAPAATLQTELVALVSIGADGVLVSRDAHPVTAPNGFIYSVTFIGELTTGDIPLLSVVQEAPCMAFAGTSQLAVAQAQAGGVATGRFVTTTLYDGERPKQAHPAYTVGQIFSVMNEQIDVQTITVTKPLNDIGAYKLVVKGVTTPSIPWDASEDAMEAAFREAGIAQGELVVTRRLDAANAPNGFVYTVYFQGDSVAGDVVEMTLDSTTDLNGGSVAIATVTNGISNIAMFTPNTIPLAVSNDPTTASPYLGLDATLDVFKVNGFVWTIKFKSTIGNIPALGAQKDGLRGTLTVYDDLVAGSASNSYVMTDLVPGIRYYVRVAASTDIGTGAFTSVASAIPSGVAGPVQNVMAGYALHVQEVQEVRLAAKHVTEIQEISTSAAKMAEVQTLRTFAQANSCFDNNCIKGKFAFRVPTIQTIKVRADGPITAGSFEIGFVRKVGDGGGNFIDFGTTHTTAEIAWDADADTVKTAMAALSAMDASDLIVTRDGDGSVAFGFGYVFSITFVGNNVVGETELITITESMSDPFVTTGNVPHSITVSMNAGKAMGTDTAVQEVIIKADKPLVSGSYRLAFYHLGATMQSSCISFDAPARGVDDVRAMESILLEMSNIDKVFVTRSLDPVRASNGFVYRLFFYGNGVSGAINQLTSVSCNAFQTQENNALTQNGVNGQVVISTVDAGGFTNGNLFVDAATATAAQLEQDLDRLPVFGDVIVTRSLADLQGGFVWTVAFKDSEGDLPQFICAVDSVFTIAAGTSCETSTLTDGNALSGTFVVDSSVPIASDASATDMKAALEAMAWVGSVQIMRTGPTAQLGYTWTITFLDYYGDVPPLVVTSSLVGTTSAITVREVRKGNSIGGTFTLTYLSSMTQAIAWNAAATAADSGGDGSSLQETLEALSVVGRLRVSRSTMDREGGFTYRITFLDNAVNPGDLPLLIGDGSKLTGEGVVVTTRELRKGSNAVGDQLWLSFDPPVTDNGSPITKYVVRWDTSATFTASPGEVAITEPEKLYQTQRIETGASSRAWSNVRPPIVQEVQKLTIAAGATAGATFTLSFRGVTSTLLTIDTSTAANLLTTLNALSSIGIITVSPTTGTLSANAEFLITFTTKPGGLPMLDSSDATVATVTETTTGETNYRKEVVVFTCTGDAGTVEFDSGSRVISIVFDATLAIVTTQLHTLYGAETGSIRVLSSQAVLCAAATPAEITIVFDRVYGDLSLTITSASVGTIPTAIVVDAAASIDGVFNDVDTPMSGTFQVGYKDAYTRALNAGSSASDVRYALEDLATITTVAVTREPSAHALPGKLDVVNGDIFVTCSTGETCNFKEAAYGLPGSLLRIGGTWYTVLAGVTSTDEMESSRLYLGDLNGREVGYTGVTQSGVTAFEWMKGYVWTVQMLKVAQPLGYLRAKIPRLYPSDAAVKIIGSACDKCYYLPNQTTKKLTMGQVYFIDVTAFNENGKGQAVTPVRATPSQVPNAPSNVDLLVVSGKEIEVFFSPPVLASTNVHPNFNNDISQYIVQWDVKSDFKHGLVVCSSCAVALKVNVLTTSLALTSMLQVGTKFTIADENCALEVVAIAGTRVDVAHGHGCTNFNGRTYPIYYYTFKPAILSGLAIQGSPPFRYVIPNLVVATRYFVRVAAVNSVPVQQISLDGNPPNNRRWSFPLSATTKDTVPDPPLSVSLLPFSGTTLELQIQPPTRDGKGLGGAAITHFWVDVDTVSTFDSVTKQAPVDVDVTSGDIPLLYTGGPRVYYIENLQTGVKYFVQVKTKNAIGYSRATLAPNPLAPSRNPDGPVNVKVSTVASQPTPITAATVTWQPPVANGGLPVTSYRIEWWGDEARPEIQTIEIKWTTPPTATFKLAFGGVQTGSMPLTIAPQNLRSALMNIVDGGGVQLIQHVQVSRATINVNQGVHWRVTFAGARNAGNQPMIQMAMSPFTDGLDVTYRVFEAQPGIAVPQLWFPGKPEVQVLMTSHPTTTVGGYFRLSFRGSRWSSYLSATISAADLKLALEALPTVGKVSVTLQGTSLNGRVWAITFESAMGNLPALTVDASKITPATGAFVGIKDGDNAVDDVGNLCVPGEGTCTGTWSTFTTGIASTATVGEAAVEYNFYETIDASSLAYRITGLMPGKTYYVAVTAKNALGLGVRGRSSPSTIIPPVQVPSAPTAVSVDVNPGVATQLTATWSAPLSDGGGAVRMYRVEYDPSPLFRNRGVEDFFCPTAPTNAVWRVQTFRNGATGDRIENGYFNLVLTRNNVVLKTDPIPWDAVAMASSEVGDPNPLESRVFCTDCSGCIDVCDSTPVFPFSRRQLSGSLQSKLEYLSTINSVNVVRSTIGADGGYTWTVTFQDVGDDFVLAPDTPNSLTCLNDICGGGDYRVTTTKLTAGVNNPACTGTQVIPTTGALNKGQLYYVRVFAFNRIGFSPPGSAPNPQKPMVVPGPPTGVTLQVASVSELKVLLSPPDDNGGDTITEYLVEWSTSNAFTTVHTGAVVQLSGGAPFTRVISNLVKGQFYFVRVKARNSQGYGQYQISSPPSLNPYTTPSAPTKVTMGLTASTMLTVQWHVPDDDGGDAITGYIVQWDISAGFDSLGADATKLRLNDVTQRSYTITLLTPGTVYYVRVFAVNSGGAGTAQTTTPASLVPANTRPGKPHTLQVAATANAGELRVTWQPPRIPAHGIPCSGTQLVPLACPIFVGLDVVFGGSSFESYLVHWSENSDFTGFSWTSVTTTSALLTGLDSGKTYFVRVLTVNSEGLKSDFCGRANTNGYLCPDPSLVLLDGSIITGTFVSGVPT